MKNFFQNKLLILKDFLSNLCFQEEAINDHEPVWQHFLLNLFFIEYHFKCVQAPKDVGC